MVFYIFTVRLIMFALMGEVNFWTFDDNISIEDTDFGAFK